MAGAKNSALNTHERRLLESESRWLQKALFALAKAEDDRDKLVQARKGEGEGMTVSIKGKAFDISTVRSAMSDAVQERADQLRETLGRREVVLR
jgi:hypothetical protein